MWHHIISYIWHLISYDIIWYHTWPSWALISCYIPLLWYHSFQIPPYHLTSAVIYFDFAKDITLFWYHMWFHCQNHMINLPRRGQDVNIYWHHIWYHVFRKAVFVMPFDIIGHHTVIFPMMNLPRRGTKLWWGFEKMWCVVMYKDNWIYHPCYHKSGYHAPTYFEATM
jgi:hypothetical protein